MKRLLTAILICALLLLPAAYAEDIRCMLGGFSPIVPVVWHSSFEDSLNKIPDNVCLTEGDPAYEDFRVQTQPNGDLSVQTAALYTLYDAEFDLTLQYSETGLYACNLRHSFEASETGRAAELIAQIVETLNVPDYVTGYRTDSSTFEAPDSPKAELIWDGGNGTFLKVQCVLFMSTLYLDINDGLLESFPKTAEKLGIQ